METDKLMWLAGLLEGEGCFFLSHGNSPAVVLKMKDKDVVERAHALMGGNFRCTNPRPKYPHWSVLWSVALFGKPATALMQELLPYMGERRSQKITEVLSTREQNAKHTRDLWQKARAAYWAKPENRLAQSKRLKARHINGKILFPSGYEPPSVEKLDGRDA
jgi:hypothetical protein